LVYSEVSQTKRTELCCWIRSTRRLCRNAKAPEIRRTLTTMTRSHCAFPPMKNVRKSSLTSNVSAALQLNQTDSHSGSQSHCYLLWSL